MQLLHSVAPAERTSFRELLTSVFTTEVTIAFHRVRSVKHTECICWMRQRAEVKWDLCSFGPSKKCRADTPPRFDLLPLRASAVHPAEVRCLHFSADSCLNARHQTSV
jgi:hypothetical protein